MTDEERVQTESSSTSIKSDVDDGEVRKIESTSTSVDSKGDGGASEVKKEETKVEEKTES